MVSYEKRSSNYSKAMARRVCVKVARILFRTSLGPSRCRLNRGEVVAADRCAAFPLIFTTPRFPWRESDKWSRSQRSRRSSSAICDGFGRAPRASQGRGADVRGFICHPPLIPCPKSAYSCARASSSRADLEMDYTTSISEPVSTRTGESPRVSRIFRGTINTCVSHALWAKPSIPIIQVLRWLLLLVLTKNRKKRGERE